MTTAGERIRNRRNQLKMTQEELAEKAEISKGFLSDVETGKRNISAENLLGIARALNVSLDYLMKGDQTKPQATAIKMPHSLIEFAKNADLTVSQALMLLEMKLQIKAHRSNTASDDLEKFDWKRFYDAVRPFLK
jgi:transcriptional regulator with XRE-family HTH domain